MSMPLCISWIIWIEKNRRCSEDKKEMLSVVKYRCMQNLYYRMEGNLALNLNDMLNLLESLIMLCKTSPTFCICSRTILVLFSNKTLPYKKKI